MSYRTDGAYLPGASYLAWRANRERMMRKMRSTIKDRIVNWGFFMAVLSVVTLIINEKTALIMLGMSLGTIIFGGLLKSLEK